MFVRLRLDIAWRDLLAAAAALVVAGRPDARQRRIEASLEGARPTGGALACLSVRSALDLYLGALRLPKGSEVLMTALNVPDMAKIVERHGLVPVPVDVNPDTLAPSASAFGRAASARTGAILVAHLFGSRPPLDVAAETARRNGWLLLEDCAQAFCHPSELGDPRADVTFFSFGPIKTATALGGALAWVRDTRVLAEMRATQARYPLQRRLGYAARVLRFALLVLLSRPRLYGRFAKIVSAIGRDLDDLIHASVRAFPGARIFDQVRRRPSAPLLALLERRLTRPNAARIRERRELGREIARRLPAHLGLPGQQCSAHTHWVFPILTSDPARLISVLRDAGFDATSRATLDAIAPPPDRPELDPIDARRLLAAIVYLPVYPELPAPARERLLDALAGTSESGNARYARARPE